MNILEIKELVTSFQTPEGQILAADRVSLDIPAGQVTALVGESGSGKSITALSILRLISSPGRIESGQILLNEGHGEIIDLLSLNDEAIRHIRGNKIAMIFQEPMTSLNPVYTVGDQIIEAIRLHQHLDRKKAKQKAIEQLARVGISHPEMRINSYPHELSGGMRQRVMIAMALSCQPSLLVADEPTTALDVTIQAQILELIGRLIVDTGMTVLLITHDLGVVAQHAQRVAVMYAGQIVEEASTLDIFSRPRHPYTRGLLASIPSLKQEGARRLTAIPGVVPHLASLPKGCRFADRCDRVREECRHQEIPFVDEGNRKFRCLFPCS